MADGDITSHGEAAQLAEVALEKCSTCKEMAVIIFRPDGDVLCKPCADAWCRAEGIAYQEQMREAGLTDGY